MNNLPTDCLGVIFSYIDLRELMKMVTVCKEWKSVIIDPNYVDKETGKTYNSYEKTISFNNKSSNSFIKRASLMFNNIKYVHEIDYHIEYRYLNLAHVTGELESSWRCIVEYGCLKKSEKIKIRGHVTRFDLKYLSYAIKMELQGEEIESLNLSDKDKYLCILKTISSKLDFTNAELIIDRYHTRHTTCGIFSCYDKDGFNELYEAISVLKIGKIICYEPMSKPIYKAISELGCKIEIYNNTTKDLFNSIINVNFM
jgi:hypothetical protein